MSGSIRHFQFPFSLKAMFISANSIGDSREQRYYQSYYHSYNQGYHSPVTCYEAQKALSAEENSLAKIPLQLACETACAGEAGATCGQSKGLSKCYECFEAGSVDKKEPCFKNPASVFDLSVTEQTCTTDKGCYIKRREQTDEYGDVTWLDL